MKRYRCLDHKVVALQERRASARNDQDVRSDTFYICSGAMMIPTAAVRISEAGAVSLKSLA